MKNIFFAIYRNFSVSTGQSLLEIVIAMAIFALITASIASLILGSLSLSSEGGIITQADMLAQEGVEAVMAIKNRAWNEIIYDKSAINSGNGVWEFDGESTSEQIGIFGRVIEFFPVYRDAQFAITDSGAAGAWLDPQSKRFQVSVSWQTSRGTTNSVAREALLTNWDSYIWTQTDWSGGGGQDIYALSNKYYTDDGNVNSEFSGELVLTEIATSTYASQGCLISSAYDIGPSSAPSLIFTDWEKPASCDSCEVKIQIKSAPDNGGSPGAWSPTWSGPDGNDGDETDYYVASSTGTIINSDHNDDQWFRYKAVLVGEVEYTPSLKEIIFDYKR